MLLKEIHFDSFRSLVEVSMPIKHRCMALVGLNEAGKTNLLCGIRTLSDYSCQEKDICYVNNKMPKITFDFQIESKDESFVKSRLQAWLKANTQIELNTDCTIRIGTDFKKFRGLDEEKKVSKSINFSLEVNAKKKILRFKKELLTTVKIVKMNNGNIETSKVALVRLQDVPDESIQYFEDCNEEQLKEVLWDVVRDALNLVVPKIVYWEYEDTYLIPSEMTYEEFLKDNDPQSVCIPLYNIFLLAADLKIKDEADLEEKMEEWKQNSSKRKTDSVVINRALNQHIKDIWKEYNQDFSVVLESDRITVHITDPESPSMSYYEMEQRSQGFLSFISFLLTISAETKVDKLSNYILVLDEPENHLHPSGVRFMRDELLKLAEKGNYVFFATHSIFMVDRNELKRHVIVKKEHEKSLIRFANKTNLIQEAVLYSEGFGTNRDEFSIGMKNIVFEGEIDREIFEAYNSLLAVKEKKLKDFACLVGGGVTDIERFFKNILPAKESCWVLVLDKDSAGKSIETYLKDRYESEYQKQFKVYFYSDLDGSELEDVLPVILVQSAFDIASAAVRKDLPSYKFKKGKERTIAGQMNEFKSRNNFDKKEASIFEENFKRNLSSIVRNEIKRIKGIGRAQDRRENFETTFANYIKFFEKLAPTWM